ncbi:C40 family peptidase [Reichenbachiella carrageenanivorans]|uniref:C40 family peptidase n=1 Tax=Reichenbachiella carrageenanivorans TaxID=2979869 RepID=A0ABY6CYE7_9BACT|nr:C40 family peptidase [Reichenbachiella carrageenanivorans]UXX78940.1 C40 family peptidase [Reichenbachiella carrageenanivorans]
MIHRLLFVLIFLSAFACQQNQSSKILDQALVSRDSIKQQYAPDSRVALFDIQISQEGNRLLLAGQTDQYRALATFMNILGAQGIQLVNQVNTLPDESTLKHEYAIVTNSVANLRTQPKHSAELATQAILGTVLKVLKITEEWYYVQTPDDYIAWVDHGGVALKTNTELQEWQAANKVIVTTVATKAYFDSKQKTVLSDLVLGNVLMKEGQVDKLIRVRFPDGRFGYVSADEVKDYQNWLNELKPSGYLMEYYARQLMGTPYLWGGTSAKAMDCSGFTKTVYLMNGLVIPRDASQQVNAGIAVDLERTFEELKKGDLLFFGKPATDSSKQRITHVGLWLGAGEFIHASERVRISSIDPAALNYDEFNKNRYLGSRRYLNHLEGNIEQLKGRVELF